MHTYCVVIKKKPNQLLLKKNILIKIQKTAIAGTDCEIMKQKEKLKLNIFDHFAVGNHLENLCI